MKSILIPFLLFICLLPATLLAQDIEGSKDHTAITRYPGSVIKYYLVENYLPYEIALGPITGYRHIEKRIKTEGRVTRIYYEFEGERTHSEIYKNYKDALIREDFEIIADGHHPERNVKNGVGGGSWIGVAFIPNPIKGNTKLHVGSSSSGGTAAVYGMKKRPEGTIYVLVVLRQYSSKKVVISVDVIEEEAAETGFVTADAEAMGEDIDIYGKVAVYGIHFDFDKATLKPESKPALDEIAKLMEARPDLSIYVVGHTDSKGTFAYNMKLSHDRALAVTTALKKEYGIASKRLEAQGVGPLVPVSTNKKDAGREKNRRVELVEK